MNTDHLGWKIFFQSFHDLLSEEFTAGKASSKGQRCSGQIPASVEPFGNFLDYRMSQPFVLLLCLDHGLSLNVCQLPRANHCFCSFSLPSAICTPALHCYLQALVHGKSWLLFLSFTLPIFAVRSDMPIFRCFSVQISVMFLCWESIFWIITVQLAVASRAETWKASLTAMLLTPFFTRFRILLAIRVVNQKNPFMSIWYVFVKQLTVGLRNI